VKFHDYRDGPRFFLTQIFSKDFKIRTYLDVIVNNLQPHSHGVRYFSTTQMAHRRSLCIENYLEFANPRKHAETWSTRS
jgi:hypothetical protein